MRALGRSPDLPEVWEQVPAFYFGNPANIYGPHDDVAIAPDRPGSTTSLRSGGGRPRRARPRSRGRGSTSPGFDLLLRLVGPRPADERPRARPRAGQGQGLRYDARAVARDATELADHRLNGKLALDVAASVNGERVAAGTTADMDWTFGEVVSFCSRGVDLRPGDVIGSGTIPGGCLLEHLRGDPALSTGGSNPVTCCPCTDPNSGAPSRPSWAEPRSTDVPLRLLDPGDHHSATTKKGRRP